MIKTREEILKAIEEETERFKNQTVQNMWQKFEVQFAEFKTGLSKLVQNKNLNRETLAVLWNRIQYLRVIS